MRMKKANYHQTQIRSGKSQKNQREVVKGSKVTALRLEDFRTSDDVEWFVTSHMVSALSCVCTIYDSDAEWFVSTYPSRRVQFGIVNYDRFRTMLGIERFAYTLKFFRLFV